jgi:hypothetical protein
MGAIWIFQQYGVPTYFMCPRISKSTHNLAHQFSGESEPALNISALSERRSALLG